MILKSYRPKIGHLRWYDKILIGIFATAILVSLYVYACTCSLRNIETIKILDTFFFVIKALDYVAILMIVIGLLFSIERVLQFQQLFGLVILGSVIIVTLLQFLPYPINEEQEGTIKYSLLCPQYSIISWLNLFWFSVIGLANFAIPTFIRKK